MTGNRKNGRNFAERIAVFMLAAVMAATSLPLESITASAAELPAGAASESSAEPLPAEQREEEDAGSILSADGTVDGGELHSLSGRCGTDITYSLEQGILTLTGSGTMNDYYIEKQDPDNEIVYFPDTNAPWSEYAEEIRELVLDDRITTIGEAAFMNLSALTDEICLPADLETVGKYAFSGCWGVNGKLVLPEALISVGDYAFQGCNPQKVYVSNSAMKFGQNCIDAYDSVFYGAEGSTAEAYAKECGYRFFVWTPGMSTYTVTFDSNGGSEVSSQEVEIGGTVSMPAQPVREGWYFMGWYLDGQQFDFRTVPQKSITLTARWSDVDPATLAPVLMLKNMGNSVEEAVLMWERRFDEKLLSYEIYRAVGAEGEYIRIGSAETSASSYTDAAGLVYDRSKYHYKIQAVYEGDVRSPFSNVVSTEGMIYNGLADWDEECVRAEITDAQGNPIDSLTLHVGEAGPELHVRLIYKDGSGKDWKTVVYSLAEAEYGVYCNEWRVTEGGFSPINDDGAYARFLPTFDYLGVDYKASGASARLVGIEPTPADKAYYVSVTMQGCMGGIAIPLTVLEAEPGVKYETAQGLTVHENTDDFWEEVRASFRDRQESFGVLMDYDVYEKAYGAEADPLDLIYEEAFDFYEDRVGMKPGDGDYLQEGITGFLTSFQTVSYYGEMYQAIVLSGVGYLTTVEQETWVDEEIDKMVNSPGGRFYSDRNKSDYDKIKAVYEYVADQITWVDGTTVGLYHTAYSGLHDGIGTCQSYALLFYRLVREMGISSRVLAGTDAGAHGYNIVELGGQYYYIDCSNKRFLKGDNNFQKAPLQDLWQDPRFIKNFMDKISEEDYRPGEESVLQSVTALNDEQIRAIDGNLLQTADKMAAVYTLDESDITARNAEKAVLMPVYGCTGYLGVRDVQAAEHEIGYYLALRIQADQDQFTQEGRIEIACETDGEWVSQIYQTANSTLKDGYVDVILNLSKTDAVTITVDYDTDGKNSVYQAKRYNLRTAALRRAPFEKFSVPGEESVQGMEISSYHIGTENGSQEVTVSYDCVAYSVDVQIPGRTEKVSGNYVALRTEMPESMRGTGSFTGHVTVETPDDADFYSIVSGENAVICVFRIAQHMEKEITIAWTEQERQTIRVRAAGQCVIETIDAEARLPKSIKFNGIAKTMYVGQEQTADITIVKNYEGDKIQKVFTSSDPKVLSVNRVTGVLQALKPGTATITVTARDGDGTTPKDAKGGIVKGLTASVKITIKKPSAPGSIKLTNVKDTSATVNWKANATGQEVEIYALPVNKDTMGKAKKNWKEAIETELAQQGMDDRSLSALTDEERQRLQNNLQTAFRVQNCCLESASAGEKTAEIVGLRADTAYVFYLRTVARSRTNALYYTGTASGQIKTKKKILTQVNLAANDSEGTLLSGSAFIIENDNLSGAPAKLSYSVEAADAVYTKVSYKSSNPKVLSIDKNGVLKLGSQVGVAQLYVTGKDASGAVRESNRITVRVVREPKKLTAKKITLALGQSVRLRDMIGYDIKGSVSEINLEKVDFDAALAQIRRTNCFAVTQEGDAADALITASAFLTDDSGKTKAGNTVQIPFGLYAGMNHAAGESTVSAAEATVKVVDMGQPVVKKIIARDTSATVEFKPNATVREPDGETYYYTAEITDQSTGEPAVQAGYRMTEAGDSTEKNPLYTCSITGLSAEHSYSIRITAHYGGRGGAGQGASKSCGAKRFRTLKPLLTEGGYVDIRYADLRELRENPDSIGQSIDYNGENIVLQNNETYIFMAQVKKLNRVMGADKLKWTLSSDTKKIATLKATKDTYQARLDTLRTGTFTVTVTSTLSKEVLSVFRVTVVPYPVESSGTTAETGLYGAGGAVPMASDNGVPLIRSVTARDTTAQVQFVPCADLLSLTGADGYYSISLTEKATGRKVDAVDLTGSGSETETGAAGNGHINCGYRFTVGEDSTQEAPLYLCEIVGLDRNKAYTVAVTAHKGASGSQTQVTSAEQAFTTRKAMLTADDVLRLSVVSMEELIQQPEAAGTPLGSEGLAIPWKKAYALTAEVNTLSRALETEKLIWSVSDKNAVSLKVSPSTFEVQLEVKEVGVYTVTAVSSMTKRKLAVFTVNTMQSAAEQDREVYEAIIAMKEKYPEGTKWTNDNYYAWKGGIYAGGYGCAGFAFMLSDAAFGSAPARKHTNADIVRVGDIARMNGDTHSVIILEVRSDSVIVAEGNYNTVVHWGREISRSSLEKADYFLTRY